MPDALALTLRYALFALVATAVNIGTQAGTVRLLAAGVHDARALWLSILLGTATGLVTKYVLDKRWIFMDRSRSLAAHSRRFTLYSLMGVVTTLIFWATEWTFDALSGGHEGWRYAGAVLGLAVGYTAKYRLDRRFVFAGAPA